jgi:G:T-mismatch repair DNA endonuclease (very short patch repair protein)
LGWHVVVVWECETKNPESLSRLLRQRVVEGPASFRAPKA